MVYLLETGHDDVDEGNVVDAPGDQLRLVKVGPSLSDRETNLNKDMSALS